jgi:hypothetical protein
MNRLKRRPQRLGRLIDLANYLPRNGSIELALLRPAVIESEVAMGVDVEETMKVDPPFKKWFLTGDPTQWRQFSLEPLRRLVTPQELLHSRLERFGLPMDLADYLRLEETGGWRRWQSLYSSREYLYELATDLRKLTREFLEPWRLADFSLNVPPRSKFLYIDRDGFLRAREEIDEFFEVLEREDFEPARIKVCPRRKCQRLFWAGRIARPGGRVTMEGCTPECNNVLNVRRSRARKIQQAQREAAAERK